MMTWKLPAPLTVNHRHYPDGVAWRVGQRGIALEGEVALGTTGPPVTVQRVWQWFGTALLASATKYGVPVELLVAIIATESAGGQTDFNAVRCARREEPGYLSDLVTPGRVSVGCMQTLITSAREATDLDLKARDLQIPAISIDAGAAIIAGNLHKTGFDPVLVAAAYNAGGLYYENESGNRWRLRCFPTGTGQYIDRFVSWFNDSCQMPGAKSKAEASPSFVV